MTVLHGLSLRARVLAAIALVLASAVAVGGLFAGWQARQSLHEELAAALLGGRQTVASAFEDLGRSDHPARDLDQLVATFDGNRHVAAALVASSGAVVRASTPLTAHAQAPGWFAAWLDARLDEISIPTPAGVAGYAAIRLRPIGGNDLGDAWLQFRDALIVLLAACGVGVALVFLTIGRALRPLSDTSAALARIGAGDYAIRVGEGGPPELSRLSRAFNAMAQELAGMRRRNAALEEQILKLQDEERAEIARDLHDEIGPHLFAVNIDAAMAAQSIGVGRSDDALARLGAIQTAVRHMQTEVKDILSRLRPARLTELGFEAAIVDLVDFWRGRSPRVAFTVDIDVDACAASDPLQETIYRVVQEALSNAIRHGAPGHIDVAVWCGDGQVCVRVDDDGAAGGPAPATGGQGLVGMRERVEATGGELRVQRRDPSGWSVEARLPAASAAAPHPEAAAL